MAGEITQEAIMLALGGAGVGATGAIGAQIVAAIFTAKREKKKALADEVRWEFDSVAKRRDRNMDQKAALFVRFLSTVQEIERKEAWANVISDATFKSYGEQQDQLEAMVQEVSLIAPDVYRHVYATKKNVSKMLIEKSAFRNSMRSEDEKSAAITNAEKQVQIWLGRTQVAMRAYIDHREVVWPDEEIQLERIAQMKGRPSNT
ncbi:hypothetical protein [Pseudarthrobacter sp. DSP2-3-2b1]|uniref:hypothetical protein n=1 Tax=Pseudarthrobacter sp. DSP2-3-2b1 TaxID=2804661 RepID=UPI003CF36C67